jgi:hypothetical protein
MTSGGTRCKEDAIYVFHLQQCSSRHPPDLSIGIYPSYIKKSSHPPFPPCLSQCNPTGRHSARVSCLPHFFSSVLRHLLYPFSCHAPSSFSELFASLHWFFPTGLVSLCIRHTALFLLNPLLLSRCNSSPILHPLSRCNSSPILHPLSRCNSSPILHPLSRCNSSPILHPLSRCNSHPSADLPIFRRPLQVIL